MGTTSKLKRGAASNEEVAYVHHNMDHMTDEEMAQELNRSVRFIAKLRAQAPVRVEEQERNDAVSRLHRSHIWPEIKRAILPNQVSFFEQAWAKLVEQFSTAEILETDEMMMKDLILLELGTLEAVQQKRNALKLIQDFEKRAEEEEKKDEDDKDFQLIGMLNQQITSLRTALPALSKQQLEYQQRKDQKLRDLKATRDLRFRHHEESRRNFFELIKELDHMKKRKSEGRWVALMKMGADKVEEKWNEVIEYEDGTFDKPFLSPEGELKDEQTEE